jgi:hypothetical protein
VVSPVPSRRIRAARPPVRSQGSRGTLANIFDEKSLDDRNTLARNPTLVGTAIGFVEIVGSCILSSPKQSLDAPHQEMSASKRFDKSLFRTRSFETRSIYSFSHPTVS